MANKRPTFVTAIGDAVYPKISKPDTYGPKADGKFKTDLKLSDADTKKLQDWLKEQAKELLPKVKKPKMPWKVDDETGEVTFRFASKYRPPVFDAVNPDAIPEKSVEELRIGGGSRIKIIGAVNAYDDRINLYLNGVRLIELKQYESKGAGGNPFGEAEDGFTFEREENDDASDGDSGDTGKPDKPFEF